MLIKNITSVIEYLSLVSSFLTKIKSIKNGGSVFFGHSCVLIPVFIFLFFFFAIVFVREPLPSIFIFPHPCFSQ
jgi:hypothetical protein